MKPTDVYEASISRDFEDVEGARWRCHIHHHHWSDEKPWKKWNVTSKYIQSRASKMRRRFAKDDIREQLRTLEL